jgi:hypothetical protein
LLNARRRMIHRRVFSPILFLLKRWKKKLRQRTIQRHFYYFPPSSILTLICKDKKLTDSA